MDLLSLLSIPNWSDLIQYFRKQRLSITDLPLFIRFENSIKAPDPEYNYFRNGARQTPENLVSSCAYVQTFSDGIDIVLRYPRITCRYLPHRKCPYDDVEATVRLLNHEFIHSVLDFIGEPVASDKWDNLSIAKLMAKNFPDTYCQC